MKVLDFGCGGSPYRGLFANADFARADLPGTPDVDYVIQSDNRISAPDESFDLVLSTQVVEHAPDQHLYLTECYRLLRPGGQLIVTTHGVYEEHASPGDYQRWTSHGLRRDLQSAGFTEVTVLKLTTGPRAVMFFMGRGCLHAPPLSPLAWFFFPIRVAFRLCRPLLHRLADRHLFAYRVIDDQSDTHGLYVGLLASATKPS